MPHFNPEFFQPFGLFLAAVLGLCIGSFASALVWRIPRGLSWIREDRNQGAARSQCPVCGTRLKARDLIPLLSWIVQGGKCRHCHTAISVRYPLMELSGVLVCMGIYDMWGITLPGFLAMVLSPFLIAFVWIMIDKGSENP